MQHLEDFLKWLIRLGFANEGINAKEVVQHYLEFIGRWK